MIVVPAWLSWASFALAVTSLSYTIFALARVLAPAPSASAAVSPSPSVTLLKPLAGLEPDLEENLRSFCNQEYSRYQTIFCSLEPRDPALAVAERVAADAPACDASVVAGGGGAPLRNPKIANVAAAMPHANGDIVIIADSDMRVEPDYLRKVTAAFADGRTGAVTTLYGARATESLAAHVGALFVNDYFAPSVLVALALQPLRYCFGATMAVRRSVLDEIGGIDTIGGTIADDYALGALVSRCGYRIALASAVPLTLVSESSFAALFARELRWARTIRSVRPLGYVGTIVEYPIVLGVIAVLLAANLLAALALLAACVVARCALHVCAHRRLRIPGLPRPWLIPLREALGVMVWACGLFGSAARWRERAVSIGPKGC